MIGYRMREECRARGVPHDIEVDEDKRIYGDAWYLFLSNCRAVLGTDKWLEHFRRRRHNWIDHSAGACSESVAHI